MAQVLYLIGAAIITYLGVMHLILTFFSNKFEARDPSLTQAMQQDSPRLTRETTMWQAWLGFNASHSLGAILLGAVYLPLSWAHLELLRESLWFASLPSMMGLCYLVLAKKYWFKIPLIGIAIATACFLLAFSLLQF